MVALFSIGFVVSSWFPVTHLVRTFLAAVR